MDRLLHNRMCFVVEVKIDFGSVCKSNNMLGKVKNQSIILNTSPKSRHILHHAQIHDIIDAHDKYIEIQISIRMYIGKRVEYTILYR